MDGRALIDVARELAAGSSEAHWRSSVGRAYYALLHEVLAALRHWGFSTPPRDRVHTFARLKLVYATDIDLKRIGLTLEALGRLRNAADYQLVAVEPVPVRQDCRFSHDRFRGSRRPSRRPGRQPRAACHGHGVNSAVSIIRWSTRINGIGMGKTVLCLSCAGFMPRWSLTASRTGITTPIRPTGLAIFQRPRGSWSRFWLPPR